MADYYVNSLTGSNSNSGTLISPFATISRASAIVRAGDTVHVAAGTYRETVTTSADGTASAPITFVSDGAILAPPTSGSDTGWSVSGDHITLNGFTIDGGTAWRIGVYVTGSYDTFTNGTIRNIALGTINNSSGGGGIVTDNYNGGVHNDVTDSTVFNIGNDSLDQGIYISTSGEVRNNTVYNVSNVGIHLWHNATNVLIQNNIVHDNSMGILVGSGDYYNGFAGPNDNTSVVNNTVYHNQYGISEQGNTGTHNTYIGNLVYDNTNYNYSLQNGNSFIAGTGATTGATTQPSPPPDIASPEPVMVPPVIPPIEPPVFTGMIRNSNLSVTLEGGGMANTRVTVFDGVTQIGTATVGAAGTWKLNTSSNLSDAVHLFFATTTDAPGDVSDTSGSAQLGSSGNDKLTSTTGDDIMTGGGRADTFSFGENFGKDTITDFRPGGYRHDFINFTDISVLNDFSAVMSHATDTSSGVVIRQDANNTLTLLDVSKSGLRAADFTFS